MKALHGISLCIAVTACTEHGKSPPPGTCIDEASLNISSTARTFGPHDVGNIDVCLHLDMSAGAAHFTASTDQVDGATSPWLLRLTDSDGNVLGNGWDVSVGETAPRTFANLEVVLAGPMQLDATLRISAKSAPASTSIVVALMPAAVPD